MFWSKNIRMEKNPVFVHVNVANLPVSESLDESHGLCKNLSWVSSCADCDACFNWVFSSGTTSLSSPSDPDGKIWKKEPVKFKITSYCHRKWKNDSDRDNKTILLSLCHFYVEVAYANINTTLGKGITIIQNWFGPSFSNLWNGAPLHTKTSWETVKFPFVKALLFRAPQHLAEWHSAWCHGAETIEINFNIIGCWMSLWHFLIPVWENTCCLD